MRYLNKYITSVLNRSPLYMEEKLKLLHSALEELQPERKKVWQERLFQVEIQNCISQYNKKLHTGEKLRRLSSALFLEELNPNTRSQVKIFKLNFKLNFLQLKEHLEKYGITELYATLQVSIETKLSLLKEFGLELHPEVRTNYEKQLEKLSLEIQLDAFKNLFEGSVLFLISELEPEKRQLIENKLEACSIVNKNPKNLSFESLAKINVELLECVREFAKEAPIAEFLQKFSLQVRFVSVFL